MRCRHLPSLLGLSAVVFSAALCACTNDSAAPLPEGGGSIIRRRDGGTVPAPGDAGSALPLANDASGAPPAAATDAALDASEDSSPSDCSGDLPVMTVRDELRGVDIDPDWSCYDGPGGDAGVSADAGLPDTADASTRSTTFRLSTLLPSVYADVTVDFFFGSSTLGPPALTRVFEADAGAVQFAAPPDAQTVSVRVRPLPRADPAYSIVEAREYDLPIPSAGTPLEGFAVIRDMRTLAVSLALGGDPDDPTKAVLMSAARDCSGRPLRGARFELVDGDTNVPVPIGTAPGSPRVSYSKDALPSTSCSFTTDTPATWMLVDAPVNVSGDQKTHAYRLRLWGRKRAADTKPVLIGEREVELFAGVWTLATLHRETPR